MAQEAARLHSAGVRQGRVCEQEAKDVGDEKGARMWRRRMGVEEGRYAVAKKEGDGYLRDLKEDKQGLKKRLEGELGELRRRQVEG